MLNSSKIYDKSPILIKTIMLNSYAKFLNLERYGKKFECRFEEFCNNENKTIDFLQEYQLNKLRKIIKYAYESVPYYREIMKLRNLVPNDFNDLSDIQKLPILTRDDVKKNYQKLKAKNVPRYKIRHGHTSGTTGSPLEFLWDVSVCVAHHAADWRQKRWAGINFGDPFISLQGRKIIPITQVKPPFWIRNYIHNQLFLSSFHLKDEFLPSYIKVIKEFNPKGLEGYPSSIYVLAQYLEKTNQYLQLPAVLTSSETLLPNQRELIEKRFSCKVFDFYGMSERVVYGTECRTHGRKHLNLDYGLTEIVGKDDEVLKPGEYGTVVATGFWNHAMPLIRYKTSDSSSIEFSCCDCGCRFPLLDAITTKSEDVIVLKDGRKIPSSILTHPFKPLVGIVKSQIIQPSCERIIIKIVKDKNYLDSNTKILIGGLLERLGSSIDIRIDFVDEIPNEKSGKFKWVVSRVSM